MLDALGLALGCRADFSLIRKGASQAHVSAIFEVNESCAIWAILDELGIFPEDQLIFRRSIKTNGKSSASINDVPVSVGLMRKVGDMLVEIQGQFEGRGLLDAKTHIDLLDRATANDQLLSELKQIWHNWQEADKALKNARKALLDAKTEEEWLDDAVKVLDQLVPQKGRRKKF